jgi:alkylhydroperoxidase family enzyme
LARLPYLRYDDASETVREVLAAYPPHVRTKNVWGILGYAEDALVPMIQYGRALATRTTIAPPLRELAVLRVSRLTPGSEYIWTEHVPIALALGIDQDQIDAVAADDPDAEVLGGDGALVIRFTDQFVRVGAVDDETWSAMAARFSPREIVELIMATGHFMMFARLHATVQTDLESGGEGGPVDTAFFGAKPAE